MKLWLDDIRPPPEGWHWIKTVEEAKEYFRRYKVEEISLDHDLGNDQPTGYDLACWIEKKVFLGTIEMPVWQVHSANPVGAKNIRLALTSGRKPLY